MEETKGGICGTMNTKNKQLDYPVFSGQLYSIGATSVTQNHPVPLVTTAPPISRSIKKEKSPKHIPRPMNAFMIFSNENRSDMRKRYPDKQNKELSKHLGAVWRSLTKDEQNVYYQKAKLASEEHRRKYPDYHYRPRNRNSSCDKKTLKSCSHQSKPTVNSQSRPVGGVTNASTVSFPTNVPTFPHNYIHGLNVGGAELSELKSLASVFQQYQHNLPSQASLGSDIVGKSLTVSGMLNDGARLLPTRVSSAANLQNLSTWKRFTGDDSILTLADPNLHFAANVAAISPHNLPIYSLLNQNRPMGTNSPTNSYSEKMLENVVDDLSHPSSYLTPPPSNADSSTSASSPPVCLSSTALLRENAYSPMVTSSDSQLDFSGEAHHYCSGENSGPLSCQTVDTFPDTDDTWEDRSMGISDSSDYFSEDCLNSSRKNGTSCMLPNNNDLNDVMPKQETVDPSDFGITSCASHQSSDLPDFSNFSPNSPNETSQFSPCPAAIDLRQPFSRSSYDEPFSVVSASDIGADENLAADLDLVFSDVPVSSESDCFKESWNFSDELSNSSECAHTINDFLSSEVSLGSKDLFIGQ